MISLPFLGEWALRSSIAIGGCALLLFVVRVKSASIRLAAWTVALLVSLAIPALTGLLPVARLSIAPAVRTVESPALPGAISNPHVEIAQAVEAVSGVRKPFDWRGIAGALYAAMALGLLLRLFIAVALSRRLMRGSRHAMDGNDGIAIRESEDVLSPVAVGLGRPAILLPAEWREWSRLKLEGVLAHERSHIARRDPALQFLSAIHRALLWFSPASWLLHLGIVRAAEEASDDAAVYATGDRATYAETLLDFMRAGTRRAAWAGVPMARYGPPERRIHRILDSAVRAPRAGRGRVAAMLALGAPLAYLAAAGRPQTPAAAPTPAAVPPQSETRTAAPQTPAQTPQRAPSRPGATYLGGLGNVVPSNTVIVRPRIDGQLISVSFQEGENVRAGQELAAIDPRPYEIRLEEAQNQAAQVQAQVAASEANVKRQRQMAAQNEIPREALVDPELALTQLQSRMRAAELDVQRAELELSYTHIRSPISGVAGLRRVDTGNVVRAGDGPGIVTVSQIQPVAVLFPIPEDSLARALAMLSGDAHPPVEAWNRANTARLAVGRLIAVDNQIDASTGMATLKAVFENQDRALFPGQFVNVRMLAAGK